MSTAFNLRQSRLENDSRKRAVIIHSSSNFFIQRRKASLSSPRR